MSKERKLAFTLIELLIVVAIIAILAAIAVPNFLEAQVRAKVSRVHSDLRTLATAQETYMVDHNTYTHRDQGDNLAGYVGGFAELTSPIAYVASVPRDPFGFHRWPGNNSYRAPMYELGTGNAGRRAESGTRNNPQANGLPATVWMMVSAGPDNVDDTNSIGPWNLTEGRFPWPNLPDTPAAVAEVLNLSYDSTNGTRSGGNIFRVGGQKPNGRPYDALFSISVTQ